MLPVGPYGCLLCDPPWRFLTYDRKRSVASRTPEDPYATMSLEDMMTLPVRAMMANDSAIFMWVVDAHLEQALALGRAWGGTFKTVAFVWDKGERIGMGYWSRKQAEICLLFTIGKPKRLHADVRQIIRAPRREHSRKPAETHHLVERLVGGPYIEMFSRETVSGWESWGAQAGLFDA